MQPQQQQSSMHPSSTSPMNPPPKSISDDVVKIEPDHEGSPEDDSQSSPIGPPRLVFKKQHFFFQKPNKYI